VIVNRPLARPRQGGYQPGWARRPRVKRCRAIDWDGAVCLRLEGHSTNGVTPYDMHADTLAFPFPIGTRVWSDPPPPMPSDAEIERHSDPVPFGSWNGRWGW
jgi:hypothetical protein